MPLSKPVSRHHVHTRDIRCYGYRRDDGLWDIEGQIVDTKTYSFENTDRGGIAAGEPIHDMRVRLTIDGDMTVVAAEAATEAAPFGICPEITPALGKLAGLTIGPGWRKAVTQRLGGVHGCTHINDLLQGPLAVVAFQTVRGSRERSRPDSKHAPKIIDTCHALASDGPVVRREWPEHYTGTEDDAG